MSKHLLMYLLSLVFGLLSFSGSQTMWSKYPDPVLHPGITGSWNSNEIAPGTVIELNDTLHMWYSGNNGSQYLIGYATSLDGIAWTFYDDTSTTLPPYSESDPVLVTGEFGSWDYYRVQSPCIIFVDSIFHMWFWGDSTIATNSGTRIGHATSEDGISWEKDSLNPVIREGLPGSWDDEWISSHSAIRVESTFHLWYYAWDGVISPGRIRIGHASSTDGSHWTKDSLNPVLSAGDPGSWDYPRVEAPNVIYDGTKYYMYYSGGEFYDWQIGCAYSDTPYGNNWTKDTLNNPIIPKGQAGSWDEKVTAFCTVIVDTVDSLYKMWYAGGNSLFEVAIGYAQKDIIDGINFEILSEIPRTVILHQNYPNPFNPCTTIEFDLPKTSEVSLKVYNILGEEVVTLISDRLAAGSYSYEWDAGNLASGVYLYKLEADGYVDVRKMILMK